MADVVVGQRRGTSGQPGGGDAACRSVLVCRRAAHQLVAAVLACLVSVSAAGQTGTIAPVALPTFTTATGVACASCTLTTYAAGTTTPATTYTEPTLMTAHANPIVLDAAGRPPSPIYLSATSFKFVLKTSGGTTIWTADDIAQVPTSTSTVTSTGDVAIQVDSDNNGSNSVSITNGTGTEIANIDESGNLQFDGALTNAIAATTCNGRLTLTTATP